MMFLNRKIKKKKLFNIFVIERIENKFLIKRVYKHGSYVDFIICSNYNFSSNTYEKGLKISDIIQAYSIFNEFVNKDILEKNEEVS